MSLLACSTRSICCPSDTRWCALSSSSLGSSSSACARRRQSSPAVCPLLILCGGSVGHQPPRRTFDSSGLFCRLRSLSAEEEEGNKGRVKVTRSCADRYYVSAPPRPPAPDPSESRTYRGWSTPHVAFDALRRASLETLPLTHVPPAGYVEQSLIWWIHVHRWLWDRCFRPRFLHRALFLTALNPVPSHVASSVSGWRAVLGCRFSSPSDHRRLSSEFENRAMHSVIVSQLTTRGNPNEWRRLERLAFGVVYACQFILLLPLQAFCPALAFRLAAYCCEERTVLLTHCINDVDAGKVPNPEAPSSAVEYWGWNRVAGVSASPPPWDTRPPSSVADGIVSSELRPSVARADDTDDVARGMTLRDVLVLLRADEMVHRDVNHQLADAARRK